MDSAEIKQMAHALGADLCGIAAANRFWEAPKRSPSPYWAQAAAAQCAIQLKSNAGEMKHD
jgi:epoxyqueuosine reductase QueG